MRTASREFAIIANDAAPSDEAARAPTRSQLAAKLVRLAASADSVTKQLEGLAAIARVLHVCAWRTGELRIELAEDVEGVMVDLLWDRGAVRERALPPVILPGGFEELAGQAEAAPALFVPLRARRHEGKLLFTRAGDATNPPELAIDDDD